MKRSVQGRLSRALYSKKDAKREWWHIWRLYMSIFYKCVGAETFPDVSKHANITPFLIRDTEALKTTTGQ